MSRQKHSSYFSRYMFIVIDAFTLGAVFIFSKPQRKDKKKRKSNSTFLLLRILSGLNVCFISLPKQIGASL
jgi:preprotein translocase subunit YajC